VKHRSVGWKATALTALGVLACLPPAHAQQTPPASSATIYSCTTADGRRITSDRLIAECLGTEQRVLNRDGTVRLVVTPPLSSEQQAAAEAKERRAAQARMQQQENARRDRNLLARYPDEAAHGRARESALDTVRSAMKASEDRLRELALDRKKLEQEAEFYKNRALPPKLQQAFDANEAATEAQRTLTEAQRAELDRVSKTYDAELDRLRKLRAGAAPGSLGPLVTSDAAVSPSPA
jgi:hypothetical protein